jgi:hypothetical protein
VGFIVCCVRDGREKRGSKRTLIHRPPIRPPVVGRDRRLREDAKQEAVFNSGMRFLTARRQHDNNYPEG